MSAECYWCLDHSKSDVPKECVLVDSLKYLYSQGEYYFKARLAYLSRAEGKLVDHDQ